MKDDKYFGLTYNTCVCVCGTGWEITKLGHSTRFDLPHFIGVLSDTTCSSLTCHRPSFIPLYDYPPYWSTGSAPPSIRVHTSYTNK